jgi:L-threonylcarbamoyladenylate synthase
MITQAIRQVIDLLKQGKVVAIPTETVYGLAGDATNDMACAQIFELKGRPTFNPLISHVYSLEEALKLGDFSKQALQLAEHFWPGPLTLIVKRKANCPISYLASAGLDTIALRVPSHPLMREVLKGVQTPLAAPSANPSGFLSPTTAQHVEKQFHEKLVVLDGGTCAVGIESTIVDTSVPIPCLLRPGILTAADLKKVIPNLSTNLISDKINAPGQLKSHYKPTLPLRINASYPLNEGEALLAFGANIPEGYKKVLNLSETENLKEAAAHLFAYLHLLDSPKYKGIAVMPIPNVGIGLAINDRLKRASFS